MNQPTGGGVPGGDQNTPAALFLLPTHHVCERITPIKLWLLYCLFATAKKKRGSHYSNRQEVVLKRFPDGFLFIV